MNFEYTDIEVVKDLNKRHGQYYFSAGWVRFFRSRFTDTARFIGSVDNSQPYPLMYVGWFVFTESLAGGFRGTEAGRGRVYRINAMNSLTGNVSRLGEYSTARARDKALSAFLASDNPSFERYSLTPERGAV